MKFLLFLVISVVIFVTIPAAHSDKHQENEKDIRNICKHELNSTDETAKIFEEKRSAKNEAERCLLECSYIKLGLIKDNKAQLSYADKYAEYKFVGNPEKIQKSKSLFATCANKWSPDNKEKCALGSFLRDCIVQNMKELGTTSTSST